LRLKTALMATVAAFLVKFTLRKAGKGPQQPLQEQLNIAKTSRVNVGAIRAVAPKQNCRFQPRVSTKTGKNRNRCTHKGFRGVGKGDGEVHARQREVIHSIFRLGTEPPYRNKAVKEGNSKVRHLR
jgi:hypothetical protein